MSRGNGRTSGTRNINEKSNCSEWVKKSLVRQNHIERGLCRDCTKPAKPGTHMCIDHLRFAVERKRRWRIYHGLQKQKALYPMYQGRPEMVSDPDVPF